MEQIPKVNYKKKKINDLETRENPKRVYLILTDPSRTPPPYMITHCHLRRLHPPQPGSELPRRHSRRPSIPKGSPVKLRRRHPLILLERITAVVPLLNLPPRQRGFGPDPSSIRSPVSPRPGRRGPWFPAGGSL